MGESKGGMFQENSIETCILSRVKQITSPGWMHETSARTWCTGKTWRERVEREVGGGSGMGNTCKPMAVSFQCMTKFTTNKKIKNKKKRNTGIPNPTGANGCNSIASTYGERAWLHFTHLDKSTDTTIRKYFKN